MAHVYRDKIPGFLMFRYICDKSYMLYKVNCVKCYLHGPTTSSLITGFLIVSFDKILYRNMVSNMKIYNIIIVLLAVTLIEKKLMQLKMLY